MKKSDASVTLKYLQTLVECLCMLGKVAAAGVIIWYGHILLFFDIFFKERYSISYKNIVSRKIFCVGSGECG